MAKMVMFNNKPTPPVAGASHGRSARYPYGYNAGYARANITRATHRAAGGMSERDIHTDITLVMFMRIQRTPLPMRCFYPRPRRRRREAADLMSAARRSKALEIARNWRKMTGGG